LPSAPLYLPGNHENPNRCWSLRGKPVCSPKIIKKQLKLQMQ